MTILNKYNQGKSFKFDGDAKRDFTNLRDLFSFFSKDEVYPVRALFINKKSKFGDAPVVYTDKYIVNAPSHMVDTVKEMMADDELVDLVNDDKVGFTIYEYTNSYGKNYGLEWVEK